MYFVYCGHCIQGKVCFCFPFAFYFKVEHLEPWEKGSRKTAGQVGMCGGVSIFIHFCTK